jgi:hypothetical protein
MTGCPRHERAARLVRGEQPDQDFARAWLVDVQDHHGFGVVRYGLRPGALR